MESLLLDPERRGDAMPSYAGVKKILTLYMMYMVNYMP